MSQEWVVRSLVGLGLKLSDAEVYVFLATNGPQKARDIATALKMYKRKIYRSLKSLQSKEIVNATLECPAKFSAIPFDKVLNLLIKTHLEEARYIEQSKKEILSQWHAMINDKSAS
jgi:sugar-specific transcriptional regulator TrmB